MHLSRVWKYQMVKHKIEWKFKHKIEWKLKYDRNAEKKQNSMLQEDLFTKSLHPFTYLYNTTWNFLVFNLLMLQMM